MITQSTLPCVVDLQAGFATFDSIRIPYVGSQYPAKTRGIKLIRKYLFNNKFTLADSPDTVDAGKKFDMDQSLWSFWASMKKELTQHGGKSRRSKK